MSIKQFNQIDNKIQRSLRDSRKIGISFVFMFLASFVAITFSEGNNNIILVFGVFVSAYMAMNIGANDVANNVGPAVGSKTMSIVVAIIIAAIFEAGGAIIAGGDVVGTIKSGIVSQDSFSDPKMFIALMMAALIAAAVWLNLATFMRAPVSTTHSIIGGLLGAGLAAGGFGIVNWKAMISIVASWFISPVLGGVVAAIFLMIIKRTITYKSDKIKASRIVVPVLLFIMSLSFTLYLIQKGLSKIVKLDLYMQFVIAFLIASIVFGLSKMWVNNKSKNLSNSKDSVADLFNIPLICAAALLSFAHGANDVANAIGPMAAINQALSGVVASKAHVPIWIMIIGGFGISLGLALYGPRLIKTVGSEITDIDKIRAFCVAMSASITVLIASSLGLPVSSTHIAIGAIFGIGFLREYIKNSYKKMQQEIIDAHKGKDAKSIEYFLNNFNQSSLKQKQEILKQLKKDKNLVNAKLNKKDAKILRKSLKNDLIKRSMIMKIIAAWLITVPVSALFGVVAFFVTYQFIKDSVI